jgi:hypothetical protein
LCCGIRVFFQILVAFTGYAELVSVFTCLIAVSSVDDWPKCFPVIQHGRDAGCRHRFVKERLHVPHRLTVSMFADYI